MLANKDSEKKEAVGKLIDWITLQCDKDGLQYYWANGTLNGEGGTKDTVASGTVMAMSDGKLDFLGGQNMFDVFVPANQYANGKNLTQYDETINNIWRDPGPASTPPATSPATPRSPRSSSRSPTSWASKPTDLQTPRGRTEALRPSTVKAFKIRFASFERKVKACVHLKFSGFFGRRA